MSARRQLEMDYEYQQLADEYSTLQSVEIKSRLDDVKYVYPRVEKFPVQWPIVQGLIYNFLGKLGLTSTLSVFAIEADMKKVKPMLEHGWFMKSFIIYPGYHSALMYLLAQFNAASDRIRGLLEEHCQGVSMENSAGSMCGSISCRENMSNTIGSSYLSDFVRNMMSMDMEQTLIAQSTIQEQRDNDSCMKEKAVREEEERVCYENERKMKEAACIAQAEREAQECSKSCNSCNISSCGTSCEEMKRKREEEQCRKREEEARLKTMQENVAARALDIVCQKSRNKILESIRQQHADEDARACADMDAYRASCARERECNRIVAEENSAMEAVLAKTRQRILSKMFATEEDINSATCQAMSEAAESNTCASASGSQCGDDLGALADKFGFNPDVHSTPRFRSLSNQRSRVIDPRVNQSMRPMNRSQHSGWKIEPLGSIGCNIPASDTCEVEEPEVEPEVDECQVVIEEPQEVCGHDEPRFVTRASRASRIPRYSTPAASIRQSMSPVRKAAQTSRRTSVGPSRTRHSVGPQPCGCRSRVNEDRSRPDYVHFSRRQPSRARSSMGVFRPSAAQTEMACIAE